jgi:hypothetical protein
MSKKKKLEDKLNFLVMRRIRGLNPAAGAASNPPKKDYCEAIFLYVLETTTDDHRKLNRFAHAA